MVNAVDSLVSCADCRAGAFETLRGVAGVECWAVDVGVVGRAR